MTRLAFFPKQPDAIAIIPDPAKPDWHARFQYFRVIQPEPMVIAVEGRTIRSK